VYVKHIAKGQIYCARAEVVLGETTFDQVFATNWGTRWSLAHSSSPGSPPSRRAWRRALRCSPRDSSRAAKGSLSTARGGRRRGRSGARLNAGGAIAVVDEGGNLVYLERLVNDVTTPLQGGVPLVVDGAIVGAIGVSGAMSAQQDDDIATVAAKALD
jgi:hypothetical protein